MTTKEEKSSLRLHAKLDGSHLLLRASRTLLNRFLPVTEAALMLFNCVDWISEFKLLGSTGEGFLLSNLGSSSSDIDVMVVGKQALVYEQLNLDAPKSTWTFHMHPCPKNSGYVRLELKNKGSKHFLNPFGHIKNGLFEYCSALGSVFFTNAIYWLGDSDMHKEMHNALLGISETFRETLAYSGPCLSTKRLFRSHTGQEKHADIDLLVGFWCPEWPSPASEWVLRYRHNGWPSQEFIDKHIPNGCYVVPVGCKECELAHLDWRISFAHVEIELVHEMNEIQTNCFVLLRWLKKSYFEMTIPNVISSYIIKTTLFWTIEESPEGLWQRRKLLSAVEACLDKLTTFIQNDCCPHYFIRTCNLLTRRYPSAQKGRVLYTCLDARRYLSEILSEKRLPLNDMLLMQETSKGNIFDITKAVLRSARNNFLSAILKNVLSDIHYKHRLCIWCRTVQQRLATVFNKYEGNEEIEMVRKILHDIQERFIMVSGLSHSGQDSEQILNDVNVEDVNSTANICHLQMINGNYNTCNRIIIEFLAVQKHKEYRRLPHLNIGLYLESPSMEELRAKENFLTDGKISCISDLIFLEMEKDTLPTPFQIEFDSLWINVKHVNSVPHCFGYIVTVDPLVYVCFLRFWCSMKLDRNIDKLRARTDMVRCCGLDNISEKAMALNLLAYCHIQLEEYDQAFTVLCRALREKPVRRSTLVYIACLVNKRQRCSCDGHDDMVF